MESIGLVCMDVRRLFGLLLLLLSPRLRLRLIVRIRPILRLIPAHCFPTTRLHAAEEPTTKSNLNGYASHRCTPPARNTRLSSRSQKASTISHRVSNRENTPNNRCTQALKTYRRPTPNKRIRLRIRLMIRIRPIIRLLAVLFSYRCIPHAADD